MILSLWQGAHSATPRVSHRCVPPEDLVRRIGEEATHHRPSDDHGGGDFLLIWYRYMKLEGYLSAGSESGGIDGTCMITKWALE